MKRIMKNKEMNYELMFFIVFIALLFCAITRVFSMGFFYTLIIMFVVTLFLYVCKIVSFFLYRVLQNIYKSHVQPLLSDVKKVKQQIELDDDIVYDKSKSKQKHIERDKG